MSTPASRMGGTRTSWYINHDIVSWPWHVQSGTRESFSLYCPEAGMALLRMLKVMHGRWLLLKARENVTARSVQ